MTFVEIVFVFITSSDLTDALLIIIIMWWTPNTVLVKFCVLWPLLQKSTSLATS